MGEYRQGGHAGDGVAGEGRKKTDDDTGLTAAGQRGDQYEDVHGEPCGAGQMELVENPGHGEA